MPDALLLSIATALEDQLDPEDLAFLDNVDWSSLTLYDIDTNPSIQAAFAVVRPILLESECNFERAEVPAGTSFACADGTEASITGKIIELGIILGAATCAIVTAKTVGFTAPLCVGIFVSGTLGRAFQACGIPDQPLSCSCVSVIAGCNQFGVLGISGTNACDYLVPRSVCCPGGGECFDVDEGFQLLCSEPCEPGSQYSASQSIGGTACEP